MKDLSEGGASYRPRQETRDKRLGTRDSKGNDDCNDQPLVYKHYYYR